VSQAGIISSTTAPPPPEVPTSFVGDSGTAVPAAHVLTVPGGSSTTNKDNGITTTGSGSTLTTSLTNRVHGTSSSSGAATTDIATFPLGGTPGTFVFEAKVAGFDSTTPGSVGYSLFGTVRTDGATGTVVGTVDRIVNEDPALNSANCTIVVSGNNAIIQGTGVAGKNINWSAVSLYTQAN
jgi:hypothetical protein